MFNQFPIFLFLEQGLYYCHTEDTDATNELINDGEFVQPLTVDEIQALKRSGVHASVCKDFWSFLYIACHNLNISQDIIKKQIEQHANYSLKTEYSKEKYKKRKEAKYVPL